MGTEQTMLYNLGMKHGQSYIDKGQCDSMGSQPSRTTRSYPRAFQCGGIFFLLLLTVLVVACGGTTNQYVPGTPVATLTVVFGQFHASPTPALSPYYCGGWATDTTPAYNPKSVINVYGKFTRTQDGNPVGVNGATVIATVYWPDGSTATEKTTTSSDGVAVFPIAMQSSALNHVVLVQMIFTSPSGQTCSLTSPAFFTAIVVSPTPTTTPAASPTPLVSPTPCHRRKCGTPTVTPTATKKPG